MRTREPWRIVPHTRGVRYVLPPRDLPWLKFVGAGAVGLGVIGAAFLLGVTASFWIPSRSGGGAGVFTVLFPLIAAAELAFMLGLGLLIGWGRAELLLTDTHAVGVDRFGPLKIRRRVPLDDIASLVVDLGGVKVNDRPVESGPWADVAALSAERAGNSAKRGKASLVIGYPRATVEALGEAVREHAGASFGVEVAMATREHDGAVIDADGVPAQPAGSTALIERHAEGLTITLPARGFFKGSKGVGVFSILWMAFVSVFLVVSVGITGSGAQSGTGGPGWLATLPFLAFSLAFMGIGVGMFFFALRMGRRRAVIDVAGEDLVITRQSLGEPKTESWHRAEIDRVVAGPSGMEVNDRPVLELQIHPNTGKKIGLFRERDDEELAWMAAEIRVALGLRPGPGRYPVPAAQSAPEEPDR